MSSRSSTRTDHNSEDEVFESLEPVFNDPDPTTQVGQESVEETELADESLALPGAYSSLPDVPEEPEPTPVVVPNPFAFASTFTPFVFSQPSSSLTPGPSVPAVPVITFTAA